MAKIIEITICKDFLNNHKNCPYFEEGDEYHMCQLSPLSQWDLSRDMNEQGLLIPSWCPLPNKEEQMEVEKVKKLCQGHGNNRP